MVFCLTKYHLYPRSLPLFYIFKICRQNLIDWGFELFRFGVFIFSLYGIFVVSWLNNNKDFIKTNRYTIVEYSIFNYIFTSLFVFILVAPIFLITSSMPFIPKKLIDEIVSLFLLMTPTTFALGLSLMIVIPVTIASYNHMNKKIAVSE